jgi:hypothetical protein
MSAESKKVKEVIANAKVTDAVKDYSNHPFFLKKAEESKVFLEKNGFPEEVLKRYLKTNS